MRKIFTLSYFHFFLFALSLNVFPQSAPVISDIEDQTINEGGSFTAIDLDEVVSDPDNSDVELIWDYSENIELQVSIENHIAKVEAPNDNWFGEETIIFAVYDPDSNVSTDAATFTVNPVNDPPVISVIPGEEILQGSAFTVFDLDDYVTDVDNDPEELTWTAEDASHLMASIDGSHNVSVTYNDAGWWGSETIVFTVEDPSGASDSDGAVYTVNDVEHAPVALDDSYSVDERKNLSTPAPGVLSNDSDADGDLLSAVLVDQPSHSASFQLNADGSFEYAHDGSQAEGDAFTYRADDTKNRSNLATVTISINQVNDVPVANPDAYNVNEGSTLNISAPEGVLANDTDGDADILTAVPVDLPTHATSFTLNANGSFTYTHDGSETTGDSFTYHASDGTDNSTTVTVTITINPQNDPPVVSDIPGQTISEGSAFGTINLDAYVTDPDNTDSQISWTADGNSQLAVSINASHVATIGIPTNDWFGTETITFYAFDGTTTVSDPAVFTVTNLNDNPVLSGIETGALAYSEGEPAKQVTGSIVVTDIDNVLTSALIAITGNYQSSQDILEYPGGFGLSPAWNSSNGQLTLSGNASPADYQSALRLVTYRNSSTDPVTTARTVTFSVNDGVATSNTQARSITINSSNSAPVLTDPNAGSTVNFNENGSAVQITNSITVNDEDNALLSAALVKISTGLHSSEDVLGFTALPNITGSYNPSNGELSLSGSSTLSAYRTVLRSVTYINTSESPDAANRVISFTVNDGIVNSNIINRTVNVIPSNDPPVLAGIESSALNYIEGQAPVPVTNNITVTDPDSPITSATIVISANYQNNQDVLTFQNNFGLTGSWNASAGQLTLTGSATALQMQNALRTVTYNNTSSNPSTQNRTVRFTVSDGTNSNQLTRTITVERSDNAPVLTETSETPVSYTEGGEPVQLTSTLTVSDDDNTQLASATVSITTGLQNTQDLLTFTSATGISGSYNSTTGVLTFTGQATLLTYRNLLRSVKYSNTSEDPVTTNRIITFIVNDGTNPSNSINKTVTVTPQDDPPVASSLIITAASNRIGEPHSAVFTFTDPDGDGEGQHVYKWFRSNFANGSSPTVIAGATSAIYIPVKADGGKYIGFEVTPVDENGTTGLPVRILTFSNINAAPVASNVQVFAPQTTPGATISGRYRYTDLENNPKGNGIFRWYRSNISNPTPASPGTLFDPGAGNVDSTYQLKSADAGKYIWFRVSPVATIGSSPGDSVWSNVIGPIGSYTASIAGSDTFCYGAVMPITLTITGGKSPYSVTLRRTGNVPKDTVISNIDLSPRRIDVKIGGTYSILELTDDSGDEADISNSKPVVLLVNEKTKARISGTATICLGSGTHAPLTLDFTTTNKKWNVVLRRLPSSNDTTIKDIESSHYPFMARILTNPTIYKIISVTDGNGCPGDTISGAGTARLGYKTSPVATISGSDSICSGESTFLTVTLTAGTPPWSFSYQRNGVHAGTFSNITNLSQIIPVTQTGVYTLSVVTDSKETGCGTGEAKIAAYIPPTATISGTATICEHTSADLSIALTGKSPWKFGYHRNMTLDSTVIQNVITSPKTVKVSKGGVYRLYEVIDRNGCKGSVSGSASITITPAPDVTISGLKKAYNYEINDIDTIVGTPAGGVYSGPGVIGNFFVPRIAGLGSHNIIYQYRSSPASCYGYDTASVNVIESDVLISFENNRTRYCENDAPFTVTGVNLDDVEGYFTISGGKGLADHEGNTATITPSELEPNKYTLTYSYQLGDEHFFEHAEFDIGPPPNAAFTWATECFHAGVPINFNNNSTSSFGFLTDTSYYWKITTHFGFDSDSSRNTAYTFPETGIYRVELKIKNSYGCADTAVKFFNLRPTEDLSKRYFESFEHNPISWQSTSETKSNSWTLGNPSRHGIPLHGFNGAFSDTSCWYTEITKTPGPVENSWVTSPCFDFSGTNKPMLSMEIWRLFNSNRDGANIQVTADSGKTWNLVGEIGDGENWFNTSFIRGRPGGKDNGWSNYDGVNNDAGWVRARHGLDFLKGRKEVQFRIAYGSDGTPQNNDGIAFDDFVISDRTKMVLIEHFSNTGSHDAAKADSIVDLFAEDYGVHAIDVQYHTSNPSGDPFYEDNMSVPKSREFYYGLSEAPYALIDGGSINKHRIDFDPESKPFDKNTIIRQSLADSKFEIRVNASYSGTTLNGSVFLRAEEDLPLMELSVRTIIVESLIEGISGTNGDTVFRNVVRAMLPDVAGTVLYQSWNTEDDDDLPFTWEIENVTNINNLLAVAFIQNETTHEIFNVDMVQVSPLTGTPDPLPGKKTDAFSVYPNPADHHAVVMLDHAADSDITLEMFSNTGSLVYTTRILKGQTSAIIPADEFSDGLYVLRLISRNKLLGIRKLVVTK